MKRLVKTLDTSNGIIYISKINDDRLVLAKPLILLEIYEEDKEVEIVKGYKTKLIDYGACLIICDDKDKEHKLTERYLEEIARFDIAFDVDGETIKVFNAIPRVINLNGKWVFQPRDAREIIEKVMTEN